MGLGARLALIFAGIAAATAMLVGGASYVTTNRQVVAEIDDFLEDRADDIARGVRSQPGDRGNGRGRNNDRTDEELLEAVSADAEVQVVDLDGNIIASSGLVLPVSASDLELAKDDGRSRFRTVVIDDVEYRMVSENLQGVGLVQVARSLDESASLLGVLRTRLILVAGLLSVMAGGAGWLVAQRTTRPLRALTSAVDEVAATQDLEVPVPASTNDEVGRLALGFNEMLAALGASRRQQRQLVEDAAHELRTPLTSVTANVDWLLRAPDLDAETKNATLTSVRRELTELNTLMSEIVELATESPSSLSMVPLDLAEIVEDVVEQFRQRTGRQVNVVAQPTAVNGDAHTLARAITNLLSNADKYSPSETMVAVDVGPEGVFVGDAGRGIPEEEREAIFGRFYRRTEDRSLPGSGLGLAIVAETVRQHGGDTFVGTSPLGGARIGFTLPTI